MPCVLLLHDHCIVKFRRNRGTK